MISPATKSSYVSVGELMNCYGTKSVPLTAMFSQSVSSSVSNTRSYEEKFSAAKDALDILSLTYDATYSWSETSISQVASEQTFTIGPYDVEPGTKFVLYQLVGEAAWNKVAVNKYEISKPIECGGGGGGCFSSSSLVETPNGYQSISSLKLGDFVLTYTSTAGAAFTEFLGWLDRDGRAETDFVHITTTNNSKLELTSSHIIFRVSSTVGIESVYTSQLELGDRLVQWTGEVMEEREVVSLEKRKGLGHWAPLTSEGTLLVDGYLASCYASFSHSASQLAFAPVKLLPKVLLDDGTSQHEDGVRTVVRALKQAGGLTGLRKKF